MSLKSAVHYWVVCDGCGEQPEWEGMQSLFRTRELATEDALGGDWYRVGKTKHACGNCVSWDANGDAVLLPATERTSVASEGDR